MKSLVGITLLVWTMGMAAAGAWVVRDVRASKQRLEALGNKPAMEAPIADHAEASYCTPKFKEVLSRVVHACGLGEDGRRGCQPLDKKAFASISDADFNALFHPLVERGAILMFDDGVDRLDDSARKLLSEKWGDRRGARYFFAVARASKPGGPAFNKSLSHRRANAVKGFLEEAEKDPDLERKLGLLWLGSEYAQLSVDYCKTWKVSRPGKPCNLEAINRSTFVSWVDCRL